MSVLHNSHQVVLAGDRAVVGIDIGKLKHSATAISGQGEIIARLARFSNTRRGVDRLEKDILLPAGGASEVLIAMEATGHYWMCLYHELARRGYSMLVLNPLQTHASFRARIRKTSTDPLDSLGIARFVLTGLARATRVPDEAVTELRLLGRHRWRLTRTVNNLERYAHTLIDRLFPEYAGVFSKPFLKSARALMHEIGLVPAHLVQQADKVRDVLVRSSRNQLAEKKIDRLLQCASESIGCRLAEGLMNAQLQSILSLIETIEQQVEAIEKQLTERINRVDSPLLSLGLTPPLAAVIHAESDPITDFPGPEQYVAYAGLDPSVRESGDSVRGRSRLSKRGSPILRNALFVGAMGIYRHQEYFGKTYRKHRRRSGSHTKALVVVTHRLARVTWRLLTDNRKFTKRPPKSKS